MTKSPDRNIALELVRVTESGALAASRWMGRGDKEGADGAAVEAMRLMLSSVSMDGTVIIGEGEKDEAPMLYNGEKLGNGSGAAVDVAVDPVDGTTLTALGRGNAIAVLAVSDAGSMFDPGPFVYMEKIAVGPDCAGAIDLDASVTENLHRIAGAKRDRIRNLTAVVLDRPRHEELIAEIRAAGARIRLIPDGDVAGAISTAWPDSGADHATMRSARPPKNSAMTSRPSSPPTTWFAATTASLPQPASPPAIYCKACASMLTGRPHSHW